MKYSKFWSISLEHFVEHKPLISEECFYMYYCVENNPTFLLFQEKKHHSIPPIRTLCKNPKPLKSTAVVSIRTGKKQVRFSRSSPQIFALFEHQSPHNDDNNNKSRENDEKEAIFVEEEIQEVLSRSQSVISMARYYDAYLMKKISLVYVSGIRIQTGAYLLIQKDW